MENSVLITRAQSQPTRAAWIEIIWWNNDGTAIVSQPTRAAWIEIQRTRAGMCMSSPGRSPLGLRGLKSVRGNAAYTP